MYGYKPIGIICWKKCVFNVMMTYVSNNKPTNKLSARSLILYFNRNGKLCIVFKTTNTIFHCLHLKALLEEDFRQI